MKVATEQKKMNKGDYPGINGIHLAAKQKIKEKNYWLHKLSGELVKTCFPPDYPENKNEERRETVIFHFPPQCASSLSKVTGSSDLKMHIILTAGLVVLLDKYTGNQDICLGTSIFKQDSEGDFINTVLVLRTYAREHMTFKELLLDMKQTILEAVENRNYPVELVAKQLYNSYSPGEDFPLFDVTLLLENIQDKKYLRHIKTNLGFSFTRTGEDIEGTLEYNAGKYEKTTTHRIIDHFTRLLWDVSTNLDLKLSQIDILSQQEKIQVLFDFNNIKTDYPRNKTVHQLFAGQVEKAPDNIAVNDTQNNRSVTYNELNRRANYLAGYLRCKDIKPEAAVGIIAESSAEMIIGLLAILKAGGAYLPINPTSPGKRKKYMFEESGAKILATTRLLAEEAEELRQWEGEKIFLDEIFKNKITGGAKHSEKEFPPAPPLTNLPNQLCYIIYTSGSTGKPKGALVEHRNVVRLVKNTNYLEFCKKDRILQTGALEFDASTFEIWGALLNGLVLHLAEKETLLTPTQLKKTLHLHQISTIWMTSPLFNEMVDADINIFQHLRNLLVGGDVLSPTHIDRVKKRFPHLNVINGYGPTENTTFSTTFSIEKEYKSNIPIGRPIANSTAYIIDRYGHLAPVGIEGELLVGGDGVARGYLNNPGLTAEKFVRAVISHSSLVIGSSSKFSTNDQCPMTNGRSSQYPISPLPHSPIYRTGDLARWQPDGNIEFLGRIDLQVKIRGNRIEMGEIENALLSHEKIKEVVVIPQDYEFAGEITNTGGKDKFLCAFIVPSEPDGISVSALKEYLSARLPNYMIPSYFVFIDNIPLTSNGKIDRKALPKPEPEAKPGLIAPRNLVEERLAELWSGVLGIGKHLIGIDSNFFELGGHSLKATILIARIHKELNVKLPLAEVFKTPRIRELSAYIKNQEKDIYTAVVPIEKRDYYQLSAAQERLYILQQMESANISYNMPQIISLDEDIDRERLEDTFKKIISRHESLRTSFEILEQEPVQRIHQEVYFSVECIEYDETTTAASAVEDIIGNLTRPFDLSKAPLLRVYLLKTSPSRHFLFLDLHHIVTDGTSQNILTKDFMVLYTGEELPPLRLHYKDYSQWQNRQKQKENLTKQEAFWVEKFSGDALPVLNLPTDYQRPLIQGFEGRHVSFVLGERNTQTLRDIAMETGSTLFMFFLSVYTFLLSRLSGQEDIIVGTPVEGRRHADLEGIVGMFVNTLALRNSPIGEKTFAEFLGEVKACTLAAFENQEYQFEDLVEKVLVQRDAGRNPVFDVMLNVLNQSQYEGNLPAESEKDNYDHRKGISKFDMSWVVIDFAEKLLVTIEYSSRLFKPTTIERFIRYFKQILEVLSRVKEIRLSKIEIINKEEKQQILFGFNDTDTGFEYGGEPTIHRLFSAQAARTPDSIAVIGQSIQGAAHSQKNLAPSAMLHAISYRELDKKSHQLAYFLKEKGVEPDNIAAIMTERSIEMVVGIMGILKAGGAYLPIDPQYPPERIDFMLKDSSARVLVKTPKLQVKVKTEVEENSRKMQRLPLQLINLETKLESVFEPSPSTLTSTCQVSPTNLAYVIYTSGTTGMPKGVMVTHQNVTNLVSGLKNRIYISYNNPLKICVIAPYVFDASVKQVFATLLLGHSLYIVPGFTGADGLKLLEFYKRYNIDISDGTPTHLQLLLENISLNQKNFNLEIKHFIIGGEELSREIVINFFNRFATKELVITNVYGPTECCVDSTSYDILKENVHNLTNLPIGTPMPNQQVYIVDSHNNLQPIGVVGELYIGGMGVSRGYLNRPELTEEKFCLRRPGGTLFEKTVPPGPPSKNFFLLPSYSPYSPYSTIYKTGDLARWLEDGNIEFLGRIDNQVKIRGFRIELGEIENQLLTHPSIKESIVTTSADETNNKYLCAYIVSNREKPALTELREYLSDRLPNYMIPSYFVFIDNIPLTPNGKINHKALPKPEPEVGQGFIAPRNLGEERLTELWAGVLGIEKHLIGIDSNFFELGGHSLKATILTARIHKELNVKLPLAEVFKTPRVRELAAYIKNQEKDKYTSIVPIEKRDYYQLAAAQKRLYILQQMESDNISYNMPHIIPLDEYIDRERLEATFKKIISRHESLRTSFEILDQDPVQRIHQEADFSIEYLEYDETTTAANAGEDISENLTRPFDLSKAPLLRVYLLKISPSRHFLFLDLHHIVTDGTSQNILTKDFMALYTGEELPPPRLHYKDYSQWQNRQKQQENLARQEAFWMERFSADALPVLNLPTDYQRPLIQGFEGKYVSFVLGEKSTQTLRDIAIGTGSTLFMSFLSIYTFLLSRLSGQEDIIVGTPVEGRRHADLEGIVGMFVNTLALRNFPIGEKTFAEFLVEVKEFTLAAFENQEYQFEDLVERVSAQRDAGRNPVFDVMLNLLNQSQYEGNLPDESEKDNYDHQKGISKFDMNWTVIDFVEKLLVSIEYSSRLFKPTTIERFIRYFKQILEILNSDKEIRLSEIEIISKEEKQQILFGFNDTKIGFKYASKSTIHRLFAEQAARTPDNIAVIGQGVQDTALIEENLAPYTMSHAISYRELNENANQLAHLLIEKGVEPDTIIGIMVERSPGMIIGLLAILKAGGAYMPINPKYPQNRKKYLLKEGNVKILLSDEPDAGHYARHVVPLDNPLIYCSQSTENLINQSGYARLAYVIYTSGSTSAPKGVMVEQCSVIRLVKNTNYVEFKRNDRILPTGALEFDASTFEIWGALLNGLSLCLTDNETILTPAKLKKVLLDYQITTIWMTSPLFNQMVDADIEIFKNLKNLLVGGDTLSPPHINRVKRLYSYIKIINGYGPTENTTFSTTYLIDREFDRSIPIGRPIANSTVYILDKDNHVVPIGIYGELVVGGDGVSRGYLNNPELTAEKFITNPFTPGDRSYKTGDLVRWLPDGHIEFLGRRDYQVKIRGFRIEPGEIETYLLHHEKIKDAVVVTLETPGGSEPDKEEREKYICAYIVPAEEISMEEIRSFLSGHLPDYMIPAYFVRLENLPLTPNGKIDRKALPKPEPGVGQGRIAPRNPVERRLAELWSGVLGIEKHLIGIDSNFFELGGHSLKATILIARIHKELNAKLPLTVVFKTPRIRELSAYIKSREKDKYTAVVPIEKRDYYQLSAAQKRLYILQQMESANISYNMPQIIPLDEYIDKERLEDTFKKIISRHESLRTSFEILDQDPIQRIHQEANFSIEYLEYDETTTAANAGENISENLTRPFDLSKAPLLRVYLLKIFPSRHFLFLDLHHIVTDGTSQNILTKDFMTIYTGEELPPLRLHYKDYSQWQNRQKQQENLARQEAFWMEKFSGDALPVLNLPTDYQRPLIQGFEGRHVSFVLGDRSTQTLRDIAIATGTTLFMSFLSIYTFLLSQLSGQEDIIVGTPVEGRRHADLEGIVGMFVNTLALRNFPIGEKTVAEFLVEVKESTLAAFENQEYQFEDLVEKVSVQRDAGRNPVFDVMLNVLNQSQYEGNLPAESEKDNYDHQKGISKFDMSWTVIDFAEKLLVSIEYSSRLFKPTTIERFIRYFKQILEILSSDKEIRLSGIEIIPQQEKQQLLVIFNDTQAEYPENKTICNLFEEKVEQTPDHVAVVGNEEGREGRKREDKQDEVPYGQVLNPRGKNSLRAKSEELITITYKELNKKTHQLAYFLKKKEVKTDTTVGIMVERSIEMLIGILGILKTGGAYLPIEPDYPEDRINYMLKDSDVKFLVTYSNKFSQIVPGSSIEFVFIDEVLNKICPKDTLPHLHLLPAPATSLAYVIYTSGTTGKPKGTPVSHRNVNNYSTWFKREFKIGGDDIFCFAGSFCFDMSVTTLIVPLISGASICTTREKIELDPQAYTRFLAENRVSIVKLTPTQFKLLQDFIQDEDLGPLRYIILGGEAVEVNDIRCYLSIYKHQRIVNEYGPTEAAVATVFYVVNGNDFEPIFSDKPTRSSLPIGRPVFNTRIYILDKYMNLVSIGVVGELCIGGKSVAPGYLNKPELTAEKFFLRRPGALFEKTAPGPHKNFTLNRPECHLLSTTHHSPLTIYHTGDLARWLEDGNIEFLGRIDNQVKIRGFRIELGEIENQLLTHPNIKESIVITSADETGDKYLCAYIVLNREKPALPELREYLSGRLPNYMIPSYFVFIDNIPVTPNGKIDYKALPKAEPGVGQGRIAPRNPVEERLAELWSGTLGIEKHLIGIDSNFFELGGHSLKATVLTAKIHKEFNIRIPLQEIFKTPNIKGIAQYIYGAAEERFSSMQAVEKKGYYPLSSAQKRLYILQQMELAGTAYNMPEFIPLEKETNLTKIEETFKKLIKRHENFRTSFYMVNDEPVQRIHDEVEFEIDYYQVEDGDTERTKGLAPLSEESHLSSVIRHLSSEFIRPFDLTRAPLLRVGLIQPRRIPSALRGHPSQAEREQQSLLMVDMHHIISDGLSHMILKRDFIDFYADKTLPLLRVQYKDFSQWQNREKQKEIMKQQETYWLETFGEDIPVLNLPGDYPRPVIQSFSGNTLTFAISTGCSARLKSLARESNATLYMVLLSAFNVLLSRLSSQEDIVLGTPAAGRRHADLEKIIGMFVNTLALRNFPRGEKSFYHFLQEVKTQTLEAFENQEYPFEELVENTAVNRDASRNPLFDAVFSMENYNENQGSAPIPAESPGESSQPDVYQVAKFDLTLTAVERGDNLYFHLNYCTKLFKKETIRQFIVYFKNILSALQNNFEIRIADIVILPEEEKRQLLFDFNEREVEYPVDKTIPGLFARQVQRTPGGIAVVGSWQSAVDKSENMQLTYMELNKKANQLAAYLYLHRPGSQGNQLVGLMAGKSTEMMVGILGILKAGCGYVPLNPKAPASRILYMVNECGVNLVVTTHTLSKSFDPGKEIVYLEDLEGPDEERPEINLGPSVNPTNFAYVIFTSGSTGNPKGVPITHANFSPLLGWGYRHLGINSEHRTLQNLSYYFDWSVWEIFITLTTGAGLYAAGDEVLLNPEVCLDFIDINCIDVLHITPTQYQYLVNTGRKTKTLKYLFIGAEKLTYDLTARSFAAVSPQCRVFNMYGPTEATIISAVLDIERSRYHCYKELGSVPIGIPVSNLSLLILDRHLNLCPVSILGELYISGAGLAAGYLNDPEKSSFAFIPNRYEQQGTGGKRLYKTGDLARWQPDGEVEFLGRIDHQVKIRGFRIELGEIENHLLTSEMVKEAVVIDREIQGEKYLCAYIVPGLNSPGKDASDFTALREYLGKELPDYMIPSYFMEIEKIPLNPNGKIDRKALPVPMLQKQDRGIPPRDAIERELVKIWCEVLGRDPSHLSQLRTSLGINNNFFELGGHSLNATIMVSKIHKALDVKVPLAEIFVRPTIGELGEYIKNTIKDRYTSIEPVEKKEYYFLSPAQKRLYILQQIDPSSTVYNMPEVIPLPGEADMVKLQETLRKLIRRHESLRTSFHMITDEPVQRVHDEAEFKIEYYQVEDKVKVEDGDSEGKMGFAPLHLESAADLISSFIRPFDLTQAPLLRVGLIQPRHTPSALRGRPSPASPTTPQKENIDGRYLLMVDMHHIISDGVSHEILQKDFSTLYKEEMLPPLRIQYKEFSQWFNHPAQRKILKKQEAYWLSRFEGEIPVLDLPTDFPRPAIQGFAGQTLELQLDNEQTNALKTTAIENGTTFFMVLSALIYVLLAKLSSQQDIVIGIPVAGRRHAELDKIMGMFVNTLALRNFPGDDKSFLQFLKEVKEITLEAFENQEYPFEELVEKVEVNRDASRNPFFDVMFTLNVLERAGDPGAGEIKPGETDSSKTLEIPGPAKFDLTIIATEAGQQLSFTVQYCTDLFKGETIRRFIGYFSQITAGILKNKNQPIGHLEIITPAEKREILEVFNKTTADYPHHETIWQLFAQQAQQTPNQVALVGSHQTRQPLKNNDNMSHMSHMSYLSYLSYKEFHEKSGQLAGLFIEKGVRADTIVGLMMERSLEMMLGIFAILRAGGAYMPIDPDYPPDRIDYMLQDSGTEILLKDNDFTPEEFNICLKGTSSHLHLPPAPAASLAYIIYTSGSTGKPKGVMIEHHSVINRLHWMQEAYPLGSNDMILQKTPVVFDVSVWELFWWSFYGAGLRLLGPGQEKDPAAITAAVQTSKITTMHFVPSMLNAFLHYLESTPGTLHQLKSLKQVFSSGEALGVNQVDRFYRLVNPGGPTELINLYGPTEATVDVSYFNCPVEKPERVPIGKPIHNTHLYVLDKYLHLQPVGIPGELCISGVGLARGYLNRPQLTAVKFDHDLWDLWDYQDGYYRSYPSHKSYIIYRTGDLARWLSDGNIEFLGRMDFQVKVRGFRIELEEIESVIKLTGNLPIKEAVVTAAADASADTRLTAYIVPDEKSAYTLHRQLLLKEQGLPPGISFYEWPNGMPVYYLNRMETDFMYREIFEEQGYLQHGITLKPGACIFDIGANIGVFTLFMYRNCKNARIYSFEPLPPVYNVLSLNTSLYRGDFRVFNYAIGAKEEEVVFTYYPHAALLSGSFADRDQEAVTIKAFLQSQEKSDASGGSQEQVKLTGKQYDELLAQRLTTESYTCQVKTLSRVIEENSIETIDLLKIDVEKAEWDVLTGIKPGHWPRIRQIVIEVHEMPQNKDLLNRITGLLESKGYRVTTEQVQLLEETRLYNLYAVMPSRQEVKKEDKEEKEDVPRWYGIDELIRETRNFLKEKLPEYMVPAYIVPLGRLPLTISGKLDRNALPDPEIKAGKNYVPPQHHIEKKLVKIWSEVLGRDQLHVSQLHTSIGIDDNFFDLGGHSLKATIMTAKIKTEMNVNLPLIEVFKTPSIRHLSGYIQAAERSGKGTSDSLVLLKKGTSPNSHLFFIHDGSGEVEGYVEFCKAMGADLDFNCWGIKADNLKNLAPQNVTIKEIARKYIKKIKSLQPQDPYFIVGWSLGGTIALEMARQLEQKKERIDFLALIDSPPPQQATKEKSITFNIKSEKNFVKKYLSDKKLEEKLETIKDINKIWPLIIDYLESKHFDVEIIKKVIMEYEAHVVPGYHQLSIKELIKYLNIGRTLQQARASYIPPGKIHIPIHYFAAAQSEKIITRDHWNDYCHKPINAYKIPGDHFSIFKHPYVHDFARRFCKIINKK